MGVGIDYGLGKSNIDLETGIRFGVIPTQDLCSEVVWDSFEAIYGDATCPECGTEVEELDGTFVLKDYTCPSCLKSFYSHECYSDEPIGFLLKDTSYLASIDSYSDVFIEKSPYYTYAEFCSPCAPGACHLRRFNPAGEKTYCLGHEFFDGDKAPYVVYSVETGRIVEP